MKTLILLPFKIINKAMQFLFSIASFVLLLLMFFFLTHLAKAEVIDAVGYNGKVFKSLDCDETGRCVTVKTL